MTMKDADGDEVFNILVGNDSACGFVFDKKRDAFLRRVLAVRSAHNVRAGVSRGRCEVAFYKIRDLNHRMPGCSIAEPVPAADSSTSMS